ncbi:MAG: undecaprenyl-diphosphate phosphatase [Gammaproteobacteria bacterium]|nr:undecaprenyl-diphosphate phosphatase [Gammaproteobacteria bacterium]
METVHILLLALVQGVTEFLPISSSAHLILAPKLFGFKDQGLAFDVAVHLGSSLAVISYFRRELLLIIGDFLRALGKPARATEHSHMGWMIILSTIPIVIFGLVLKSLVEEHMRTAMMIAIPTILFALLLYWYDIRGRQQRHESSIVWKDALVIGLFQALAIFPGTSRSGITITAGLMLGLTREAASRFSFLLAIPTIMLSGVLVTYGLLNSGAVIVWGELIVGAILSFVAAYLCIHLFLRFIERCGMLPFVIYRLILGVLLFVVGGSLT